MVIRLLFPLIFLGLCFCSQSDELKDKDGDDGDKNTTKLQVAQSAEILGALGDVQFLIQDLGARQLLPDAEVDRTVLRQKLKRSMELRECAVTDQGSLDFGEFQLELSGGGCSTRMSYYQRRRVLTETPTSRVELMQFRNSFEVRHSGVFTELMNFEMNGEYRNIFEKDDELSKWKQELEMTINGKGRHLGSFVYKLEERWLESQKGEEKRVAISQRTDRFLVSSKFKVTLVRVQRYEDGKLEGSDYRLNTAPITESEYFETMQDFHNQWSVEALEPL